MRGKVLGVRGEKPLQKAVFLDRDGTINLEKEYLVESADFEFIAGVPAALKKLQDAGFLLIIVTNQSGIARGYFTPQQVEILHHHMITMLAQYGVSIDGIYFCPHHPSSGQGKYLLDCDCRKGKPGMLLQAAKDLSIDLSRSFMVGDKLADIQAGASAGCETYLVETGYGKDFKAAAATYGAKVVDDLSAAAELIIAVAK